MCFRLADPVARTLHKQLALLQIFNQTAALWQNTELEQLHKPQKPQASLLRPPHSKEDLHRKYQSKTQFDSSSGPTITLGRKKQVPQVEEARHGNPNGQLPFSSLAG